MTENQIMIIVYSVALLILLCLSFFFSSSDMVYGSVPLYKLENELSINPKRSVKEAYKLSKGYDKTISTILLLNDTINAGLDSVSTLLGVNLAYLILSGQPNISETAEFWGLVASMIVLVLKILFGEILAKSFGKVKNFKLSVLYAPVINALTYVFFPITFLVSGFGNIVSKPFTKNIKEVEIGEDDLHQMVEDIKNQGQVTEERANILHETIRYTHTEAYEIMTPRVDILAIDIDDDLDEVLENTDLFTYSRIPVYKDTIDDPLGYVLSRELMLIKIGKLPANLKDIIRKPLKFPRSTEVNDILKVFKREHEHFAFVIDEYGGLEGIITREDILEEIVGEIYDENDEKETQISKRNDGSYIVDGQLNLEDFCDAFHIDYDEIDTEYTTIGGYIIELLDDKFAKSGDVIHFQNLKIEVLAVDDKQVVEKLLVTPEKEEEDED